MSQCNERSAARIVEAIAYDPDTGDFTWRVDSSAAKAGSRAGSLGASGYWIISVLNKQFQGHKVAWLLTHGEWPTSHIDHADGVRDNNRLANLRAATRQQNNQNAATRKDNALGVKCVRFHRGRYQARITSPKGECISRSFGTLYEASEWISAERSSIHKEFACSRKKVTP